MKARVLTTVFLLLATMATAFAQNLPPLSTWKNEGGSILTIWWVSGDSFHGSFTNFAPGFQCQGIPYPAVGSVKPNGAVLLTVTFTNCNTVTNWHGRLLGNQIPTRWKLVYSDSNGHFRTLYGKNVFVRQ
jgi:hypothetical protein